MSIGYARVSTADQSLALQKDTLKAVGREKIFVDKGIRGVVAARRGFERALANLAAGDTLVVWKLNQLGRSMSYLVNVMANLGARGINFRSLSDPIETTHAEGPLVLRIMGALAEFERGLIVQRTQAGIRAAKKRGVHLGRRPVLTPAQIVRGRSLIESGESPRPVARSIGVKKSTLYQHLEGGQQLGKLS